MALSRRVRLGAPFRWSAASVKMLLAGAAGEAGPMRAPARARHERHGRR